MLDNEVYVVFSFAGGTGGTKKVFATYGKDMPSGLTPPTKENYEFLGYFDDDNNEKQYYDANKVTILPFSTDKDSL